MPNLTRKAFRAWLAANPRRVFLRWGGNWDCCCPIGTYTKGSGIAAVEGRRWAWNFIQSIDRECRARITAARCLKILDGIK